MVPKGQANPMAKILIRTRNGSNIWMNVRSGVSNVLTLENVSKRSHQTMEKMMTVLSTEDQLPGKTVQSAKRDFITSLLAHTSKSVSLTLLLKK